MDMKKYAWILAVVALLLLLAVPALTQNQPTRRQLQQQAQQVWRQSEAFRTQGKFAEAKKGYDALINVYAALRQPRFVEAAKQMSEICAALPIDVAKIADGVYAGSAKAYRG